MDKTILKRKVYLNLETEIDYSLKLLKSDKNLNIELTINNIDIKVKKDNI